jgi:hypothetical protein
MQLLPFVGDEYVLVEQTASSASLSKFVQVPGLVTDGEVLACIPVRLEAIVKWFPLIISLYLQKNSDIKHRFGHGRCLPHYFKLIILCHPII